MLISYTCRALRFLLESRVDVNMEEDGFTPMDEDERRERTNARMKNFRHSKRVNTSGFTALHYAAWMDDITMIKLLLEYGQ